MVELVEVSPRDGLQNEKTILSTDDKVALVARVVDLGALSEAAAWLNEKRQRTRTCAMTRAWTAASEKNA